MKCVTSVEEIESLSDANHVIPLKTKAIDEAHLSLVLYIISVSVNKEKALSTISNNSKWKSDDRRRS